MTVVPTGGHSTGHQAIVVRGTGDGARRSRFFGDLFMRPWAANPRWVTAFDDFPLDSVVRKAELFAQAADEDWTVVLSHEREHPSAASSATATASASSRSELGLGLGQGVAESARRSRAGGSIDSMSAAAPASSTGPLTTCWMTPFVSMKNWVGSA